MTTNIEQALKLEDDFVINFVNEVKTNSITEEKDADFLNPFFESITKNIIKDFITLFPNKASTLKSLSFKINKRNILTEEVSKLSVKEIKEYIDKCTNISTAKQFKSDILNVITFGLFKSVGYSVIKHYLKVDLSVLDKEEELLAMRALVYLTFLYKTNDTAN